MTFKVIAEAEAKRDWNEAVDWYDEHERGVGLRLDDALCTSLQTLARQPERFPDPQSQSAAAVAILGLFFHQPTASRSQSAGHIWHGSRNPAALRRRLK